MKTNVNISSYVAGRYNNEKLNKLKLELEIRFAKHNEREGQKIPDDGLEIDINMSAKHQTLFIKCENWGEYKAVGEFEELIKEALENRGFEVTGEDGENHYFKISFE